MQYLSLSIEYNPVQNLTNEYAHSTAQVPTGEPTTNPSQWMTFSKHWRCYIQGSTAARTNAPNLSAVFANRSEEDDIYPLTTVEIAEAQRADASINTSLSAMQSSTKDWKSSSLRTHYVSARKVGWLYPSHSSGRQ